MVGKVPSFDNDSKKIEFGGGMLVALKMLDVGGLGLVLVKTITFIVLLDRPTERLKVDRRINDTHGGTADTQKSRQYNVTFANLVTDEGVDFGNESPLVSVRILVPKRG